MKKLYVVGIKSQSHIGGWSVEDEFTSKRKAIKLAKELKLQNPESKIRIRKQITYFCDFMSL